MSSPRALRAAGLLASALAVACSSAPPVSPEKLAAAERRLLSPYEAKRAVVADRLEFEVSANFADDVGRPAISPGVHDFKHTEDGDDAVYEWTSKGGLQQPLRFQVGATSMLALQSASLRVHGSGDLMLRTQAMGNVTESTSASGLVNCKEIRIENGAYTRH